MPDREGHVASGDGFVYYECSGDGPNVVLFLGFTFLPVDAFDSEPRMRRIIHRLEGLGRVVRFDRRGIGRSDPLENDRPSQEQWAQDAIAVLDAIGAERAIVIGTFVTAINAIEFAVRHPERVSHLVTVEATARVLVDDDYPIGADPDALEETYLRLTDPGGAAAAELSLAAPEIDRDPRLRAWWDAAGERGASPQVARRLYAEGVLTDLRSVLHRVSAPTLVLGGRESALMGTDSFAHSEYLAAQIADARLVRVDGSGVLWFIDGADDVLDEIEEFVTGERHRAGESMLAAVAFLDIVGSTHLVSQLGDRRWREVLDSFELSVAQAVTREGGRVVKHTGDGVLAVFPLASGAIAAMGSATREVAALGVQCRRGLHVGEVVARGEDIGGLAVHAAARCCAVAEPGEILVTDTVRAAVIGSDLRFEPRGEHDLRGVPGTWTLWAVVE